MDQRRNTHLGSSKDTLVIDPVLTANAGVYTCLVKDQWGDSILTNEAVLTINQGSTSNHKPVLSVAGVRNILTAQACSLSLSATDPDSGQTLTYAMIKYPQGATLTAKTFRWTAPGQTGTDTAIFTVTDNGTPPMSDTQTVIITVSSQITVPVKVPGVKAVSKVNGYFVFSWNKVSNADSYNIFRATDTVAADFQKIGNTSDSLFGDSVKMTNYYYYLVAVNTAGPSPASAMVYSGSIKTAPVIMVLADTMVAQGKTLNFMVQAIAPSQDTVTLAATDTTGVKLPDSATFNSKTGIFTWTPTFGQLGLYKIVFTAADGNAVAKDTVKITVTKTDRPPVVQAQSVNAGRNQAITITLVATDPDGDAIMQWQVTQKPDNGTATLADSTKGSIVYTPNTGFIGADTFAVKASDGTLWSVASANVIVTVDSSKVAPKIQVQPRPDTTVNQGGSVSFAVAINNAFPTPTFTWYKGAKGSGTSLQAGTSPTYQKTGVVAADSGNYYVIVSNLSGADTSAYAHIAVNAPPSAPTLSSPANGATGIAVSPTLTWSTVTAVVTYRAQVSTASDFSTGMVVDDSTLTAASKALSSLTNNTQYYWRVNAKNAAGTSAWSTAFSFATIVAAPAVPVLSSPATNSTGVAVSETLSWGAVTGDSTYRIQVSTSSGFSAGTIIVDDSTLTAPSKAVGPLSNTTQYYWHVNAKNAGGMSAWSTAFTFTTVVAASGVPALSTPANGATGVGVSPTLTWTGVAGATSYEVQVSTVSTFATTVFDQPGVTTTSQAVTPALSNNGQYYWRVNATNAGGTSAWATANSFTTIVAAPSAPTLSAPANGASGVAVSPTLTWGAVTGAVTYRIQVSTASDFSSGIVVDDSTLTAGSRAIGPLSNATKYYWRVNAKNAGGTSSWASSGFTTIVKFALSITATNGTVTPNPAVSPYDSGTVVSLAPAPAAGYQFTGWSGDLTGNANPGSITMNGPKSVTATFAIITYTLTVNPGTGGTVTPTSPTIVNYGAATAITATPGTGYKFVNWTRSQTTGVSIGDSTLASTTVTLTSGNATVQANFKALVCSWNQVLSNNSSTQDIFSIAACGNTILAGQQQLGIQRSTDNGTTWSYLFEGGPYVNAIYQFGTHALAGSSGSSPGIYVSSDSGATWTQPLSGTQVYSLASAGDTLYAGTLGAGVISSTDNGTTWNSDPSIDLESAAIFAVAVSGAALYAGTDNGLYYRSSHNWYAVAAVPSISVYTLVTNGGALFAGTSSGLYRLNNTTGVWAVVDTGLTNTTIHSLVASGNYLFAATGGGVFITTNNGNNWSPVNGGLPGGSVAAGPLAVNSTSIFMGSGYNVYRSLLP
jgi:uncharacterized repeat protein (TIGR02543 family)